LSGEVAGSLKTMSKDRQTGSYENIPQGLKPDLRECLCGTAEAVPFQNTLMLMDRRLFGRFGSFFEQDASPRCNCEFLLHSFIQRLSLCGEDPLADLFVLWVFTGHRAQSTVRSARVSLRSALAQDRLWRA
jgi:hypothetical protein